MNHSTAGGLAPWPVAALLAAASLPLGAAAQNLDAQAELAGGREVPAETLAAARLDAGWRVPRTSWGHPSFEGEWSTDDMRSVPIVRPAELGTRETLTGAEFRRRAGLDENSLERAINSEAFLRNEYGIRTFAYSSLIIAPADGQIPEMTVAGKARAGARDAGTFGPGPFDDFEDFSLFDRCITRGVIGSILPVRYGNGLRFVQTPNEIAISYEMIHDTRVIPLSDKAFLDEDIRLYLGNSRGHWEGDTLVVETRNFTDRTSIGERGSGTRHSEAMIITERFTRVDPEMIEYIATVDDPVAYAEPFTFRLMITRQPGYRMYEYSCHEGNGAVGHSLSGERVYERQVAEAIANGEPIPQRSSGLGVYSAPEDGADVYNINAGE